MGDYLEACADAQGLPIRTGVAVGRVRSDGDRYAVETSDGTIAACQVIVATGPFQHPYVPEVARELNPAIRQIHSVDFRRPDQLGDGAVLVVGVGHSGADLAHEAALAGHPTILAGTPKGQLPFSVDSRRARLAFPVLAFVASNVLTLRTPIGRKMAPEVRLGGGPLLRYRQSTLDVHELPLGQELAADLREAVPGHAGVVLGALRTAAAELVRGDGERCQSRSLPHGEAPSSPQFGAGPTLCFPGSHTPGYRRAPRHWTRPERSSRCPSRLGP